MRQQVNALAVVSFDAPAELSRAELIAATTDALRTGSFATVEPTGVEVRGLMEEAAIYNNNGDQWEPHKNRPWDLWKGGEHILSVSVPYDYVTRRTPMKPTDAANMVAEALNFMAGRATAWEKKARRVLAGIAEVIDTTNEEHPTFVDSGADSIGFLCEWESEVRELLAASVSASTPIRDEHPAVALLARLTAQIVQCSAYDDALAGEDDALLADVKAARAELERATGKPCDILSDAERCQRWAAAQGGEA